MSGTSEGTRVPSEAALDAAVEAFLVAYDAEECEDGEGIYCAKCLKRALLAALSARPAAGSETVADVTRLLAAELPDRGGGHAVQLALAAGFVRRIRAAVPPSPDATTEKP
jgi:hypothetical protein